MNQAPESDPAAQPKSDWYAVTTRSRHEKVVAEQLWQKEIECFLPLRDVLSKWKDRRRKVQFPLFPGYLFVNVQMRYRRVDILKVPSVASIVGLNGHPLPIPAEQVDSVKKTGFQYPSLRPLSLPCGRRPGGDHSRSTQRPAGSPAGKKGPIPLHPLSGSDPAGDSL